MPINLIANEARELNVQLIRMVADLYGRVRDANTWNVLAGVKVTLDSLVSQSNSDGNYEFLGLVPGNYTITLEKDGYKLLSQGITLTQGYNELFLNITPVTQVEAYYVVSPEWKEVNSNSEIYNAEFIITNTGEIAGSQIVQWTATIDGVIVDSGSWDIPLEAGESVAKVITLSHPGYPADGAAKVKSNQMTGNTFVHFYGGMGGELAPVVLDMPETVYLGQKFYVRVPLHNIGSGLLTYEVEFYIDGKQVGQSSGSLYPNGTRSPQWPLYLRLTNSGTYTVGVTVTWDGHMEEISKEITVLSS